MQNSKQIKPVLHLLVLCQVDTVHTLVFHRLQQTSQDRSRHTRSVRACLRWTSQPCTCRTFARPSPLRRCLRHTARTRWRPRCRQTSPGRTASTPLCPVRWQTCRNRSARIPRHPCLWQTCLARTASSQRRPCQPQMSPLRIDRKRQSRPECPRTFQVGMPNTNQTWHCRCYQHDRRC